MPDSKNKMLDLISKMPDSTAQMPP